MTPPQPAELLNKNVICLWPLRDVLLLSPASAARSRRAPFQVLSREARQDPFVDLILAEDSLIFPEAEAPQPKPRRPLRRSKLRVAAHHRAGRGECPGGSKMGGFQCQSMPLSKQCHAR